MDCFRECLYPAPTTVVPSRDTTVYARGATHRDKKRNLDREVAARDVQDTDVCARACWAWCATSHRSRMPARSALLAGVVRESGGGVRNASKAPVEVQMVKCGSFLCPAAGRSLFGVLISAYSHVDVTFSRLLKEAHNAGRSVKRYSPGVPTALITHKPELAGGEAFDIVVRVRPDLLVEGAARDPGYAPQWFTRLYYYASSPFTYTIAVDSNAAFCGPVEPLISAVRQWDFAVPSQLRDCADMWPHNFMMAYAYTARTEILFERWILLQLQRGVPVDDQKTLHDALNHPTTRKVGLRVGRVLGGAALSLNTLDTKFFRHWLPAVTPLIRGPVALVHPVNLNGLDKCAHWRAGPKTDQPHVFVANQPSTTAHGEASRFLRPAFRPNQCKRIANHSCGRCEGRYAYYSNGLVHRWKGDWDFEELAPTELIAPYWQTKQSLQPSSKASALRTRAEKASAAHTRAGKASAAHARAAKASTAHAGAAKLGNWLDRWWG